MGKILIIIILIIIVLIIKKVFSYNKIQNKDKNNKDKNNEVLYIEKSLMTDYERYFYNIFKELEDELDIKIHPQINLASIINKKTNNYYVSELFRNIDFAIFDKNYEKLLLLIEINDNSHKTRKRIYRDKKVDAILKTANIKLIKFYSNYPNKKDYVTNRIKSHLIINREGE